MANQTIQHQCSFCKRVITVRDQYDLPIYDPNTGFAICKNCVREINHFLDEHESAVHQEEKHEFAEQLDDILAKNKPHIIKKYLDEYIINQNFVPVVDGRNVFIGIVTRKSVIKALIERKNQTVVQKQQQEQ